MNLFPLHSTAKDRPLKQQADITGIGGEGEDLERDPFRLLHY